MQPAGPGERVAAPGRDGFPASALAAHAEPELLSAVDECLPNGRLNPAAIGWSRHPLHRCNLPPGRISRAWPRRKKWDYWCVTTDTHLFSLTYADLDYVGLIGVWILDYGAGVVAQTDLAVPFAAGFSSPETVGGADIRFHRRGVRLDIVEENGGTRLRLALRRGRTAAVDADLFVALPPDHQTLNVLIPWSDTRFQFTSKHNTRPAQGHVVAGGQRYEFGRHNHAFGCLDYGRGLWPYRTVWNWASASGICSGRTIGLNFGGKWTDGTGTTENGVCLDGRLHKISEDLAWWYDRGNFKGVWRIRSTQSDRVDFAFTPFFERRNVLKLGLLASELHVCFGYFSGRFVTDGGETIAVRDLFGWAEEHRARW